MPAIARKTDTIDHGGTITSGSSNWNCNGLPIARVGDTINCDIHGPGTITSGSPKWQCNGQAIARVGSTCSCGAVINSGSSNWNVD